MAGRTVAAMPIPPSITACEEGVAESVIEMDAVRDPAAVGLKVTLIMHEIPAIKVTPQFVVSGKSPELVPVTKMDILLSTAVPVFENMMLWTALGVPTVCALNTRLAEETLTTAVAVPVRLTVCSDPHC